LAAHPWISIETRDGHLFVDGSKVEGPGSAKDQYRAACQRIADEVASPLGRRVGVTVVDAEGVARHVAVHPDGTVEDIDQLIVAASAPLVAAGVGAGEAAPEYGVAAPSRSRRPAFWAFAAALAVVLSGALAISNGWGRSSTPQARQATAQVVADPSSSASPAPAAPSASAVAEVTPAKPKRLLVGEVKPDGICRVAVLVGTTSGSAKVRIVLRSKDGSTRKRQLSVDDGITEVHFEQLPAGRTQWQIRSTGAKPLTGHVYVMPAPES
jgi:class 3 adenylate cyclase